MTWMGIGKTMWRRGGGSAAPETPDGNPSNLVLTVVSDTEIDGTFTEGSTNQDGFRVYMKPAGDDFSIKTTVSNGSFQATGLTANTLYYFYVVAYKGSIESDPTDTENATTLVTPPLDLYSAFAAHGLRKLRTAYSGYCINVRRSSDDATQDIGFLNGVLDTVALLSFVGAGSGYVTKIYDQSANGLDLSHADTTKQPLIVDSGVLCTSGDKPCLTTDGSNDGLYRLNISQTANKGFIGMFLIKQDLDTASGTKVYAIVTTGASKLTTRTSIGRGIVGGKYFHNCRRLDADSTDYYNSASNVDLNQKLITIFSDFTNSNGYLYINGVSDATDTTFGSGDGSTSNTSSLNMSIGGTVYDTADSYEVYAKFTEILWFNTDVSALRTAIEYNQANYYGVTLGSGATFLSGEITYTSSIE